MCPHVRRSVGRSAAVCTSGHTDSRLWLCWLRLVLGFGLWSSLLLARLHAMSKLYLHNEEPLW